MIIYHYHTQTRTLIASGMADPDPRRPGYWLVPAHATPVPPPECEASDIPVFDPEAGGWTIVPDRRGQMWYRKKDGRPVTIDTVGLPDDSLTDQPPPSCACWDDAVGAWVYDLTRGREAKFAEIRAAFARGAVEPIRDAAGVEWHGGYESAQKLDGAWRLAERSGLAEVIFYDTSNVGHTLPLAAADEIVKLVAGRYQQDFGRKQALMVVAATAGSAAELESITWEPGAA